eukprot:TRINITY_DN27119_c0_g1_i1.p1 TRINITY_DN27119_c0_g1~~TRINITY_DN27119_c0_g1_i1.p1  ORF type:complete len:686 (-),score=120.89 TRINITY_DN27119_c0_g1_i1:210-2099(-)
MAMVRTRTSGLSKSSENEMLGVSPKDSEGDGMSPTSPLDVVDDQTVRQIDRDLPRTFPGDPIVRARLPMVRSVLLRYAAENEDIGYCQGMNFVAGAFAIACHGEDEAFYCFRSLVEQVRGLWLPGFPLLEEGLHHFEALAAERPWFQHLCSRSIDPSMYLPQAWLAMFATWLPLATLLDCLSCFEQHGFAGILAMTLAILDQLGEFLLRQDQQDDLQTIFGPKGLLVMVRQIPAAPVLQKSFEAWLQAAAAQIERPSHSRVKKRKVTLVRHGPWVAVDGKGDGSPGSDDDGFLGGFMTFARQAAGSGADFALKSAVDGTEIAKQTAMEAAGNVVATAAQGADVAFRSALEGTELAKQKAVVGATAAVDFAHSFLGRGVPPDPAPDRTSVPANSCQGQSRSQGWFGSAAGTSFTSSLWAALPGGQGAKSTLETGCSRAYLFPNDDRLPLQQALTAAKRATKEESQSAAFGGLHGLISASSFVGSKKTANDATRESALATAMLTVVSKVDFDAAADKNAQILELLERLDARERRRGRPPVGELQKSLSMMLKGPPPIVALEQGVVEMSFDIVGHGDRYQLKMAWPKKSLLNAFQPLLDAALPCLGGTLEFASKLDSAGLSKAGSRKAAVAP